MGHVDSVFRVRDGIVPDPDCYGDEPTCLLVPGAGPDGYRDEPTCLLVPGAGPDGYRDEPTCLLVPGAGPDGYRDEPTCLLVPGAGIEPALCCQNWILNPARLPVPPPGQCQMNKARKTNKSTHFELEIIWVL
jgi:hypothetical protein